MDAITTLDAQCVPQMVADSPIAFTFQSVGYIGTAGPRDTMKMLTDGGFHADEDFVIMAAISQFDGTAAPAEKDTITIYLNSNGIPCGTDDAANSRNVKVQKVGRSGAALTFTIRSAARG